MCQSRCVHVPCLAIELARLFFVLCTHLFVRVYALCLRVCVPMRTSVCRADSQGAYVCCDVCAMYLQGDQLTTFDGDDGLRSALVGMMSGGFSGHALSHSDIGASCRMMALSVCPSVRLSVCLSFCQSVCLACLPACQPARVSVSVCLSVLCWR
jgi:hypothetical protein